MRAEPPMIPDTAGASEWAGHSRAMVRVLEQVRHLSATSVPVLVEGESGTGKALLARTLHRNSPRAQGPFVAVDCSALPPGLLESEIFGREGEGAPPVPGALERADGGALLLDEIGSAAPAVQVRLLRALQDREFERVGGARTLSADVRLLAATRHDLADLVAAGRFREDLARRLGVVRIRLPALRERREDIPLLVQRFLRDLNREHGRRIRGVSAGVLERLVRAPWPGNLRELRNTLEGMVVSAPGRGPLDLAGLPAALRGDADQGRLGIAVGMTVEEAERRLIEATLRHTGHDKPRAAAMLGMGLRTLYRKIERYRLG